MKVILKINIDKLGKMGDAINVADGFGRNYLLKKGMAVLSGSGVVKELVEQRKEKKLREKPKKPIVNKKSYREKRLDRQLKQNKSKK